MGKCGECKWWGGVIYNTGLGKCRLPNKLDMYARYFEADERTNLFGVNLATVADFGCVCFEAKEAGK